MSYYKRHLPHWQPKGAEYFITFRLASTLTKKAIEKLRLLRKKLENQDGGTKRDHIKRATFQRYEQFLDNAATGPTWLAQEEIADIVQKTLHYYDGKKYSLYAFCIMANHVHMLFWHFDNKNTHYQEDGYPVTNILHSIKSYTALECNKVLNREGAFWQSESYDRVVRNQKELENKIRYILLNPVKAGFVESWEEWVYTYCEPEIVEEFESA